MYAVFQGNKREEKVLTREEQQTRLLERMMAELDGGYKETVNEYYEPPDGCDEPDLPEHLTRGRGVGITRTAPCRDKARATRRIANDKPLQCGMVEVTRAEASKYKRG